jgi:hypothetical protein
MIKPIFEFIGWYEVSDMGEVWSRYTNRVLKGKVNSG